MVLSLTAPAYAGVFSRYANVDLATRTFETKKEKEEEKQPAMQGDMLKEGSLPAAYNAPAATQVKNTWDWDVTASYIYWQALQEGMTLGWAVPSGTASGTPAASAQRIDFDFKYQSGFKVGFGTCFNKHDAWALDFEYTRLNFTENTHKAAPTGEKYGTIEWLLSSNQTSSNTFMNNMSAQWKLNLNIADGYLARPFYNGTKLTLTPFFGVRAAWINQKYNISYTSLSGNVIASHNNSTSWGLGARGGFSGNWLLGYGFRVQGSAAGSLLYTQYNINHSESNQASTTPGNNYFSASQKEKCGRFIGEVGLGLGWGMYVNKNREHFDILASYDFTYLPNQNVMRLKGDYNNYSSEGAQDLMLQGLTVRATLDF